MVQEVAGSIPVFHPGARERGLEGDEKREG